jgi:hypothetical protein
VFTTVESDTLSLSAVNPALTTRLDRQLVRGSLGGGGARPGHHSAAGARSAQWEQSPETVLSLLL